MVEMEHCRQVVIRHGLILRWNGTGCHFNEMELGSEGPGLDFNGLALDGLDVLEPDEPDIWNGTRWKA